MNDHHEPQQEKSPGTKAWGHLPVAQQDDYLLSCIAGRADNIATLIDLKRWQAVALFRRIGVPEQPCLDVAELHSREQSVLVRLAGTTLGARVQRAIDRRDNIPTHGLEPDPFDIQIPEANKARAPSPPASKVETTASVRPAYSFPQPAVSIWSILGTWLPLLAVPGAVLVWGIEGGHLTKPTAIAMAIVRYLLFALMALLLAGGISQPLQKRGVPKLARWFLVYLLYVVLFFVVAVIVGIDPREPVRR